MFERRGGLKFSRVDLGMMTVLHCAVKTFFFINRESNKKFKSDRVIRYTGASALKLHYYHSTYIGLLFSSNPPYLRLLTFTYVYLYVYLRLYLSIRLPLIK